MTQNTNGDTKTLTYDAFNHLVSVDRDGMIADYTYRADGLRHGKTVNGFTTTHVWDRGSIVLEMNPSGAVVNRFSRGLGHLIHSDQHGFYLFNVRGDIVQRVDSYGDVLHTYMYDAFGNQLNGDDVNTNPFRFAGEYYDWETGFIYLRARFYNPVLGRFISEDPHWNIHNMQFGNNPRRMNQHLSFYTIVPDAWVIMQAGNLFVYCANNPVMFIDPSGESLENWQRGMDFMRDIFAQHPEFTKNTKRFITEFGTRIPDFFNANFVGEIKNVAYQSLTPQIRGFLEIARDQNRQFVLIVSEKTRLSKPLMDQIAAFGGAVYTFGSQGLRQVGDIAIRTGSGVGMPIFIVPPNVLEHMERQFQHQLNGTFNNQA